MEILSGDRIFALNADKNNNAVAISEFYSMGRRQTKASFVTVVLQAKLNAVPFVLLLVGSNHIRLLAFARMFFW